MPRQASLLTSESCLQGSQRSSRGSADADAQRLGQAEQHYLRGHALRKQVSRSVSRPLWTCPPGAGHGYGPVTLAALSRAMPSCCCMWLPVRRGDGMQGALGDAEREFTATLALVPGHFKALFNRAFVHDQARVPAMPASPAAGQTCLQSTGSMPIQRGVPHPCATMT